MADDDRRYQKLSDTEHVLKNPDMYLGSAQPSESHEYVCGRDGRFVFKKVELVEAVVKMVDEALINSRDHAVRQAALPSGRDNKRVSFIKIDVGKDGRVCVENDGNGISVRVHEQYQKWIPQLIFGEMRTSTNYDKGEKKIVGGKNGVGIKLAFIWSTTARVETLDHLLKKRFSQTYRQNLSVADPPVVVDVPAKELPFTRVSFELDLARLGLPEISDDTIDYLRRRAYDLAACTGVRVFFNSPTPLDKMGFHDYSKMFDGDAPPVYAASGPRWEFAVGPRGGAAEPSFVAFVNGVCTTDKRSSHVKYFSEMLASLLADGLKKKKMKKDASVSDAALKKAVLAQLRFFLRCDIVNPTFNSQTKTCLTTPVKDFGSACEIPPKFVAKLLGDPGLDLAARVAAALETKVVALVKKKDGGQTSMVRGIPKLVDAGRAGSKRSHECSLILVEGDSAKAGAVSGLSKSDREFFGVYPLKGKLLNTRGACSSKVADNKEISELKKILGLAVGASYSPESLRSKLRYGRVVVLTDQDLDGHHIKSLVVNLFHDQWRSLALIPGFLCFMNTPIVKAFHGQREAAFYSEDEYRQWLDADAAHAKWRTKYYKGLGTSSPKEFKEYFAKKEESLVMFAHSGACDDRIDMLFNGSRANDRKEWLKAPPRAAPAPRAAPRAVCSYADFIDKDVVEFSRYSCARQIPALMDGLKPCQRKILHACFKKNLLSEIKVAQLAGYTSEQTCYHHGEQSLNDAITHMGQNFTGSNHINLLKPSGQFGTRLLGGKDAASPRYIYTSLEKITRSLFCKVDDDVLDYNFNDGAPIEPKFFAPVIPMILVNKTTGVGTGFSTDIPPFDPLLLVDALKQRLRSPKAAFSTPLVPYVHGFTGESYDLGGGAFMFAGSFSLLSPSVVNVSELPPGVWTDPFKSFLDSLVGSDGPLPVKSFTDRSTDVSVNIDIAFPPVVDLAALISAKHSKCPSLTKLHELLKITSTTSLNNMHAYDTHMAIRKYSSPLEILTEFFDARLLVYVKRKELVLGRLRAKIKHAAAQKRYICDVISGCVDLRNKKSADVVSLLVKKNYEDLSGDGFGYLIKMPMDSVTYEKVEKLSQQVADMESDIQKIVALRPEDWWFEDLVAFEKEYRARFNR